MIKNFIWDFDGTIYDSYPHSTAAFCMVLDKYKIEYDKKRVLADLQITFDYAFEKYGLTKGQILEFRSIVKNYDLKPLIVPYEKTGYILRMVLKNGGKNFIYTHRDTETLEYYLRKYDLMKMFEECVTADYGFEKKPSPQGVRYIVEKFGLKSDETVMIGDRELDVQSGVGAGVLGCLITDHAEETQTSAQYVFNDISEIENIILK